MYQVVSCQYSYQLQQVWDWASISAFLGPLVQAYHRQSRKCNGRMEEETTYQCISILLEYHFASFVTLTYKSQFQAHCPLYINQNEQTSTFILFGRNTFIHCSSYFIIYLFKLLCYLLLLFK